MERSLFLRGILYLALVPILIFVVLLLFLYFSLLDSLTLFIMVLYSFVIYLGILFQKNSYTDSKVLDMVEIPNAPEEIVDIIKTKTLRNKLINITLISILGKKKKLSQTDLVKGVLKTSVELSHPAIVKYISALEDAGIFASKKGAHKIDYVLTEKGKWCYKAIKKCFPKRFFFFILRHYLGIRGLPEFPKNNH